MRATFIKAQQGNKVVVDATDSIIIASCNAAANRVNWSVVAVAIVVVAKFTESAIPAVEEALADIRVDTGSGAGVVAELPVPVPS